ncbi:hypothetical protein J4217_04175 [Candidatus Pacearchaeota archaeon]|nr:hypothetical protein [Candidatus Pacearchaeota archaeon]
MIEQKYDKRVQNSAIFDSISPEHLMYLLHGMGNVRITGCQVGYYNKGTWPAFLVNHLDGTGHLESLGGHIWTEFDTKKDYSFSAREGVQIGILGQDFRDFGRHLFKAPEDILTFVADKINKEPFSFRPKNVCPKGQIPYLQYLQVLDDHRVVDEYGKNAETDLFERRNGGEQNGCVVKVTTIYPLRRFKKFTSPPNVEFVLQSYDDSSLIHRIFGQRTRERILSEVNRIVEDSIRG